MKTARLLVTSETKNLTAIGDFVTSAAEQLELDQDQAFAILLAVDEACANIIQYAYAGRTDGSIEIAIRSLDDGDVVVTIRDHGHPFNPDAVPEPDIAAPLEERNERGLGLYLIRKMMDSVEFDFHPVDGNLLTMRKGRAVGEQRSHIGT